MTHVIEEGKFDHWYLERLMTRSFYFYFQDTYPLSERDEDAQDGMNDGKLIKSLFIFRIEHFSLSPFAILYIIRCFSTLKICFCFPSWLTNFCLQLFVNKPREREFIRFSTINKWRQILPFVVSRNLHIHIDQPFNHVPSNILSRDFSLENLSHRCECRNFTFRKWLSERIEFHRTSSSLFLIRTHWNHSCHLWLFQTTFSPWMSI